jgi:hypothetical protein
MCRAYRFAPDLDKAMLHLLGLSSVRKHSCRAIVQVASDSHPFNIKRDTFERALLDAEQFHKEIQETSPISNLQENYVVIMTKDKLCQKVVHEYVYNLYKKNFQISPILHIAVGLKGNIENTFFFTFNRGFFYKLILT